MSFVDTVIPPTLAFELACVVANCNQGCAGWQGGQASAYTAEITACADAANAADLQCLEYTGAKREKCRDDADEMYRVCANMVDKRYGIYLKNGGYPNGNPGGYDYR